MFYDERLKSPISKYNVGRIYGIDPVRNEAKARRNGIFPVVGLVPGYSVVRFDKEKGRYRAIMSEISINDTIAIRKIKSMGIEVSQFRSDNVPDWDSTTQYSVDDIVEHNGQLWKATSSSQDVEPELTVDPEDPSNFITTDWVSL